MKHFTIILLASTALSLSSCNAPENSQSTSAPETLTANIAPQIYPSSLFHETTNIRLSNSGGHGFSSDGSKVLASSDQTGIYNSYVLDLNGDMKALTVSDNAPLYAHSFFPHDDRIIVQGDQGGNELDHVFVRLKDGTLKDLTPGEKTKASFVGWSGDNTKIYISTNEREPSSNDLYAYDVDTYYRELIFENDRMYLGAITNDGRYLSLTRRHTSANADLYIADLHNGGKITHVTPHEGNVAFSNFSFTSDGLKLVYGTNAEGEFQQAWTYDIQTAEHAPLIQADWDVRFVFYSPTGRYRVSGINNDALTELTILDTTTNTNTKLNDLPEGALSQVRFNANESQIAFGLNTDTSPVNIYTANLKTGVVKRLTDTLPKTINEDDLVTAKVIRYKSFDGVEIPAIFYMPKTASAAHPAPALVWVHGGPGGQSRRGYSAMIQHLVNNGYAVLAANNRGSSGYGKTFFHMDDRQHGEADLKDIIEARTYLESLPEIDKDKIGILGGSYGGFMTVAALAFYPDAYDVGIDIFGVTNWERTLKSIPVFWGAARDALYDEMGDPATNAERHRRISPLFSADKITKPLYVMQGANDPRVLQAESDEMVAAVRANGVPVDYVLFPDEGHGIQKRANRITNSDRILTFLDTYLKKE